MKLRVLFLCLVLAILLLAVFWSVIAVHFQGSYALTATRDPSYDTLLTKAFVTAYALATLTAQRSADIPRQNVRGTQVASVSVNLGRG